MQSLHVVQNSGFWRSTPLCKQQSLHIGGVAENAGPFHRFGALGTGRLGAGFLALLLGLQAALLLEQPFGIVALVGNAVATVQFQDSFGNPVPVAAPAVVSLTSSSTAGTFYSDPICGTAPITSRTAPAGSSIVNGCAA